MKQPGSRKGRSLGTGSTGEVPRYVRIRRTLEARIADGVYPVGSVIPTEHELAAEFSTSRFTVREALRELAGSGLVERRPGIGTQVVASTPKPGYHQSFGSLEELYKGTSETHFAFEGCRPAKLEGAALDSSARPGDTGWLEIRGVRWTKPDGEPICYATIYIPKRFAGLVTRISSEGGPIFALLERQGRQLIHEVVQEIRALPMPDDIAGKLGLEPGAWSLQVVRRYLTKNEMLMIAINWHPADRMRHVMRIQRSRTG